jgi:hypothetical protein
MATAHPGQSTNRRSAKPPDPGGGVAGEAPFRVFRYAPASPFHLTRYETKIKTTKPLLDLLKKSINQTKSWQQKGDHFITQKDATHWFTHCGYSFIKML